MHIFLFFSLCGQERFQTDKDAVTQIMNDSIELHYEVRVVNIFPWEKHGPVIPTSTHPLSVL